MAQVPATSYESTSLGDVAEFTIPFPFLSRAEVFVTVDGASVPFTWINDGLVQLSAVPELGAVVRRYRSTAAYVPLHQFSTGVPFLPRYVDRDFKQTLYAVQESVNDTAGIAAQALSTAEESVLLVQDAFDILGERTQYIVLGPYGPNLNFQTTSQVFSYDGEFYAPGPSIVLPYTTTGVGAAEIANFRSVGDAILRSDLENDTDPLLGSSLIGFLPSGVGAVGRKAQDKLRDTVSIRDFGAAGDGTANDYPAWSALVAAYPSAAITCEVPAGSYTCGTPITIPKNIQVVMHKGARVLSGSLVHFTNVTASSANSTNVKPWEPQLGAEADQGSFSYLELSGNTAAGGNIVAQNADLVDTTQHVLSNAGGSYARYSEVRHGGASSSGGFVGAGGFSYMTSNGNNSANVSDSVGVTGFAASLGYNYGGTVGSPKGGVFGANFYARMDSGATNFLNLTGCEFNTDVRAGASVAYKTGIQIVGAPTDAVKGSTYDCAIGVSNQAGAIGRDYGILFGPMNGINPISVTGAIIGHVGSPVLAKGIDFSTVTFNSFVLKSKATTVLDGGLVLGDSTTATRFVDFKSAGNPATYNARILCQGGSAADGSGDVSLLASVFRIPATVPLADATSNLGGASLRFNTIFASNGTINTSDAREKTEVRELTNDEIEAAKALGKEIGVYKFLSAVAQKGDGARSHIGMTVQRAIEIMQSHGLAAESYSFICHDIWEDGDRYGFKMDELYAFICAGLEARLSALEKQ